MTAPLTLASRLAISPDCAYQTVGTQAVAIVPSRRRQHFFENETAAEILRGIEAGKPLSEIRDGILAAWDVTPDRAERDLLSLCERLVAEGVAVPVSD